MKQYWDIKSKYPEMILMFRLGDFYEMFGDDAIKIHPILEVTLTKRNGLPMCGIPHHSVNTYIKKLVNKGLKVAICDQLEDSSEAIGIVKRGVTRVITPGTLLEDSLLESKYNNFLMAVYFGKTQSTFAAADISTGDFFAGETDIKSLEGEITKYNPGEILISKSAFADENIKGFIYKLDNISEIDDSLFSYKNALSIISDKFGAASIKSFDLDSEDIVSVCGAVLNYIKETQPNSFGIFNEIKRLRRQDFMYLDSSAIKNLEILNSLSTGKKENSLLDVLDSTKTPMGARTIRQWLIKPLLDKERIINRQNAVHFFVNENKIRSEIAEHFSNMSDLERIAARIVSQTASPRDLIALKNSLIAVEQAAEILKTSDDFIIEIPQNTEIIEKISNTVEDEPPINIKDGNIIKRGINSELDELRRIATDTKTIISDIEARERKETKINNLKIGYTSVFGYYIELTKSFVSQAPKHYIRKQTLTNAERYITDELKNLEEKILSAQEKLIRLENHIFNSLRQELASHCVDILRTSRIIAEIDIFCGLALNAVEYDYCKPEIDDTTDLSISGGKHPVVERILKDGEFAANDVKFNQDERILILTGPNMSGKSTYLRQTALIVIMAQIGSFVPAQSAKIGITDKIFTRIGAGDNLAGGESTFMVEMNETAKILRQYTQRSLIILDEVGRGTSTYDGMSIAWAILEFFADKRKSANKGSKILFATHYFELTVLENKFEGIVNLSVSVKEWNGDVVFLHKIKYGSADKSYGIHVAKIAGIPHQVIERAYRILNDMESKGIGIQKDNNENTLDLFAPVKPQILVELENLDIDTISPVEAFNMIREWKEKYKE
ncbi:MAG: DNA mismatch repair protein MutS [Elusimicrobiota bacterium]|jgi:DNA mismatch repair protein MutS|nr:DNA mismatch repair protein MutS [Elusimicrobiota bacterium]